MKAFKLWQIFLGVIGILFIILCIYGLNTDCPNTAGYVFCGNSDDWSLQRWSQQKVNN
jgi:hypothetical protein